MDTTAEQTSILDTFCKPAAVSAQGPSNPSQDYIDRLQRDTDEARRCLEQAVAAASKAQAEYQDAEKWEQLLKAYFDRLKATLKLASGVITMLDNTSSQASAVCTNINCTLQALEILTIEVMNTSKGVETLKQLIKKLLDLIACLNNPVLDPGVSIMKCLTELKTAVDSAMTASLNAITATLPVLKGLNTLLWLICENKITEEGPETDGFIKNLKDIKTLVQCGAILRLADPVPDDSEGCGDPQPDPSCTITPRSCLSDPPPTLLPKNCVAIKQQLGDCSTMAYYTELTTELEKAIQLVKFKKCVLDKKEEKRIKAQSRHEALKKALEAAKTAKKC